MINCIRIVKWLTTCTACSWFFLGCSCWTWRSSPSISRSYNNMTGKITRGNKQLTSGQWQFKLKLLLYFKSWLSSSCAKCCNMVRTAPDKQGLLKDKLQFSRTKIHSINQHFLTPFWTHYCWNMHGVIYDFYFFTHDWSYYSVSTTTLCNMTGYDLQLHLSYRNSI